MSTQESDAAKIFLDAVEYHEPDRRPTFVDDACEGNPELRARVFELLRAHAEPNALLDDEAGLATLDLSPLEKPGTQIGPYKLLQQIGEGGFGVVFMAEQERPVKRRVALKVIKPGMDTREVIARFEAERQALAMMDHPNIAKVYDAGVTENGRPYFVMELVQGIPITEYCDQCNLTTRERLELFISACQAVQHAHQKGIIHRDIKPNNVLVAIHDDRPAPTIIDFGVAKAINQQLTEHTLMTAFAQIMGTPLFMSPEQAELSPLGIDTRSDIYSLGVLLYELLTGTTPFDKDRLHVASYDELRRIIRDEDPPRPSARISTLAAELATTVAEHRRTDARRLRLTVNGELDWIVMKCLEKDRSRRYESATRLARDIERYLNDEPVQACPPSASYRFRKFARRNKMLLAAGGAIATTLVVGLALVTWMYLRERAAVQIAQTNEARAAAESARATAIAEMLQELLASSNPERAKGANYTVRKLLDDFSKRLDDQLAGKPAIEAAIRTVIGKSYWRLGVLDQSELHLKKAINLRRELFGEYDTRFADSLVDYSWNLSEQHRFEEATTSVNKALSLYRKDGSHPREMIRALLCLQECLLRQHRCSEAIEVGNEALALAGAQGLSDSAEIANVLHSLADGKQYLGRYEEAESLAQRAVEMHRRHHGDHHPETAWGLWILGTALRSQQKNVEAEGPLQESLAIFREYYSPQYRAVAGVSRELVAVLEANGNHAGAQALVQQMNAVDASKQETGNNLDSNQSRSDPGNPPPTSSN